MRERTGGGLNEIRAVVIAERGEYGRRLTQYLEHHMPPSVRICRYTDPDRLGDSPGRADYYVLDEEFLPALDDSRLSSFDRKRIIVLTEDRDREGFFKYSCPRDLLGLMGLSDDKKTGPDPGRSCVISALYSPVFDEDLQTLAMTFMKEGDLYLGFEDLGPAVSGRASVGDLCYYIRIREEGILDTMEELCDQSRGIFFLESPDLFFYLRELDMEDYHWFFDRVRASGRYRQVFLGMGNAFLARPEALSLLDCLYLVDSAGSDRQHALCSRLSRVIGGDSLSFRGEIRKLCREEILGEGEKDDKGRASSYTSGGSSDKDRKKGGPFRHRSLSGD